MKQSDIFSIIIIATVGTIAAYFAVNSFLGDPNLRSVQIKTLEDISSSLSAPDPELFNSSAINPTVEVYVGDCEDVDQNGILSREELVACGKEEAQDEDDDSTILYCPDGTITTNLSLCTSTNTNTSTPTPTPTPTPSSGDE
ncbi:MAG: hypothetical protein Q4E70_01545 [Candidatus Saccharibacteria bacterium]|nr:hypothetical protein [Candidatus Saccharibacteria bacterium]